MDIGASAAGHRDTLDMGTIGIRRSVSPTQKYMSADDIDVTSYPHAGHGYVQIGQAAER